MRIVAKNEPGQPYRTLGQLSEEEIAVLKRHWQGDTRPETSQRLSRQSGEIIQRIRQQDAWIACDCLGGGHTAPPILAPRKTPLGKYTLQRTADRTEHGENCPYRWEEGELSGHQHRTPGQHRAYTPETPDFILYKRKDAIAVAPSGKHTETQRKTPGTHIDTLARRLYCLLGAAGLNRITGPRQSLKDQLAAIRNEAKNIPLFPGKELTLSDILWTNTDWIYNGWAKNHLLQMEKTDWPQGTPLQGYLLIYTDDITGQTMHTSHGTVTVTGCSKNSRRITWTPVPLMYHLSPCSSGNKRTVSTWSEPIPIQ